MLLAGCSDTVSYDPGAPAATGIAEAPAPGAAPAARAGEVGLVIELREAGAEPVLVDLRFLTRYRVGNTLVVTVERERLDDIRAALARDPQVDRFTTRRAGAFSVSG